MQMQKDGSDGALFALQLHTYNHVKTGCAVAGVRNLEDYSEISKLEPKSVTEATPIPRRTVNCKHLSLDIQ